MASSKHLSIVESLSYQSAEVHAVVRKNVFESSTIPDIPFNNYSSFNNSCMLLLDNQDLKDGKIPQLLGISFCVWLVLTLLFLVIRYAASDYSRAALATSSQYMISSSNHNSKLVDEKTKERTLSFSTLLYEDSHWYTWFINFFYKLRNSDIRHRCGPDASLYLSLHGYIIVLLCIITIISMAVVLPVNYLAGDLASSGFPRSTISNINPSSGVLWLHTIFSLLYLVITSLFMIHYSLQLGRRQQSCSGHSVMVQWIPSYVHREDILQHLQEALPDSAVADVQMAYDISRLQTLSQELESVGEKIDEIDSLRNEIGTRETVLVGWKKSCCCVPCSKLDASMYYKEKHESLMASIDVEKELVKDSKKLGIGFITFNMEEDAKSFCESYKMFRKKPRSSVYGDVQARRWWVSTAPFPADIIWENLSLPYIIWWIRWVFINIVLFFFVFFFTTPAILITSVDNLRVLFTNVTHIPDITQLNLTSSNPLIKIFFPSLLLLLCASLLPFLVSHSSYLEAHWTKSFREQTIMRKTYLFLLLMVIILPSVGLASLNALAENTVDNLIQDKLRCAFLPNSGAFFIGYIIMTALIGTSVKLLRVPELILYTFRRARAKTTLQREMALKKAANFEFKYGIQYAWNLVLFNMIMSFSLTTPIILPFGVFYFVMTYYTDRYNIYYVYKGAPFNGRQFLHRSAINFVILGAVHLQLATLFFSIIRLGRVDPRSIIMMVTLSLTCLICIGIMFFGWFKHLLPRLRIKLGKDYRMFGSSQTSDLISSLNTENSEEVVIKGAYIPLALHSTPSVDSPNEHSFQNLGYQSFGSTDRMGRKSSSSSPTNGHHLSSTVAVQHASSTLERNAQKTKGSNGGAGSVRKLASCTSLGEVGAIKEHNSCKVFV